MVHRHYTAAEVHWFLSIYWQHTKKNLIHLWRERFNDQSFGDKQYNWLKGRYGGMPSFGQVTAHPPYPGAEPGGPNTANYVPATFPPLPPLLVERRTYSTPPPCVQCGSVGPCYHSAAERLGSRSAISSDRPHPHGRGSDAADPNTPSPAARRGSHSAGGGRHRRRGSSVANQNSTPATRDAITSSSSAAGDPTGTGYSPVIDVEQHIAAQLAVNREVEAAALRVAAEGERRRRESLAASVGGTPAFAPRAAATPVFAAPSAAPIMASASATQPTPPQSPSEVLRSARIDIPTGTSDLAVRGRQGGPAPSEPGMSAATQSSRAMGKRAAYSDDTAEEEEEPAEKRQKTQTRRQSTEAEAVAEETFGGLLFGNIDEFFNFDLDQFDFSLPAAEGDDGAGQFQANDVPDEVIDPRLLGEDPPASNLDNDDDPLTWNLDNGDDHPIETPDGREDGQTRNFNGGFDGPADEPPRGRQASPSSGQSVDPHPTRPRSQPPSTTRGDSQPRHQPPSLPRHRPVMRPASHPARNPAHARDAADYFDGVGRWFSTRHAVCPLNVRHRRDARGGILFYSLEDAVQATAPPDQQCEPLSMEGWIELLGGWHGGGMPRR